MDRVRKIVEESLSLKFNDIHFQNRVITKIDCLDSGKSIFFEPISNSIVPFNDNLAIDDHLREISSKPAKYIDNPYCTDLVTSIEYYCTSACNLACKYCYLGKLPDHVEKHDKDPNAALATIENMFGHGEIADELSLLFIGGEPLFVFSVIQQITERVETLCRKNEVRLKKFITTNGTLLTSKKLSWLDKHGFHLTISSDGLYQEKNRPVKGFGKSEIDFVKVIEHISSDKISVKTTLEVEDFSSQQNTFKYFSDLGLKNISISASYGKSQKISDTDLASNISGIKTLFSQGQIKGQLEGNLSSANRALRNSVLSRSHCSAGLGHIVIDSAGKKSPCANVREPNKFESSTELYYDVDQDAVCGKCMYRYVCNTVGGGCRAWRVLSNSHAPDPLECSGSYTRFSLLLKNLVEQK